VTGWTWEFPFNTVDDTPSDMSDAGPYNTNDRTSIMVIFDSCTDADSLNALQFKVTYNISVGGKMTPVVNETPLATVHHSWTEEPIDCRDQGDQDYELLFLTVSKPMATNSTPTVYLMNGATVIGSTVADDGIAPMLDLSISGSPYAGGQVKITVTSSEPLWEASMAVSKDGRWDWNPDLPNANLFPALVEEADEYGGYCTWFRDLNDEAYTDLGLMRVNGSTATRTFTMEAQTPQESFIVEVYAHDYTWCDLGCLWDDGQYWWHHEKWSSASQFITGTDVIELHLVEGWNLISFPRTPVNPTINGTFGDGIVNKVYTYKAGKWSGAIYNINSGLWTTPAGLTALTTLEGGVGYWVYCSKAGTYQETASELLEYMAYDYYEELNPLPSPTVSPDDLDVYVAWTALQVYLQPAAVGPVIPPSYNLSAGWNLVGVPVQGSLDQYQLRWESRWGYADQYVIHAPVTLANDFLTGLDWNVLYWYLPQYTVWQDIPMPFDRTYTFSSGYQAATPSTVGRMNWQAAWLATMGAGISIYPQELPDEMMILGFVGPESLPTASVVIPGYGYWVWLDKAGTLLPGPASFSGCSLFIELPEP